MQTSLSQSGGYNLPPCNILNLCGFHVLFDCPLDLSALTIFSPLSTSLYENLHPHSTSSDMGQQEQTRKKLLDKNNLIPVEPYYKTVEGLHLWNVSLIDVVLISSPMGMLGLPFLTRAQGFSAKVLKMIIFFLHVGTRVFMDVGFESDYALSSNQNQI